MSMEMPLEEEPKEPTARAAIFAMQRRHWTKLQETGILHAALLNTAADFNATLEDITSIQDGRPVVLGVESNDSSTIFLGFQNDGLDADGMPVVRTKMVMVGSRVGNVAIPNEAKGYKPWQFDIIEELYREARDLQQTVAPQYNTEQGTIRE